MNEDVMAGHNPGNGPLARPLTPKQANEILDKIVAKHFTERLGPTSSQPLPVQKIDIDPMVQAADATEQLLNAQLLECVGMVRDCAWLFRNSVLDPSPRGEFVLQAAKIMDASMHIANCIRRLRGGEEEVRTTRHVMVVEKVEQAQGGGGEPLPKNE